MLFLVKKLVLWSGFQSQEKILERFSDLVFYFTLKLNMIKSDPFQVMIPKLSGIWYKFQELKQETKFNDIDEYFP